MPVVEELVRLMPPRPSWLNLAMIALTGCCWRMVLPLPKRMRQLPCCQTVLVVPSLEIAGFEPGHEPWSVRWP